MCKPFPGSGSVKPTRAISSANSDSDLEKCWKLDVLFDVVEEISHLENLNPLNPLNIDLKDREMCVN